MRPHSFLNDCRELMDDTGGDVIRFSGVVTKKLPMLQQIIFYPCSYIKL